MSLQATLEANRDRYEQELNELLRIPSVSARSEHREDMKRCAEWLKADMERLGMEAEIISTPGHPIVFGELAEWNDLSRGANGYWLDGPDENADEIGLKPVLSGQRPADEGLYVVHHQHWVEEMLRAVERERHNFIPHTPVTATCEEEAV